MNHSTLLLSLSAFLFFGLLYERSALTGAEKRVQELEGMLAAQEKDDCKIERIAPARNSPVVSSALENGETSGAAAVVSSASALPVTPAASASVTTDAVFSASPVSSSSSGTSVDELRISAFMSMIGRFVSLTSEQEERLRAKLAESGGRGSIVDAIGEVAGPDAAAFYADARRRSFDSAEMREIEKETLYLSRKLSLTPSVEDEVRNAMLSVQQELDDTTVGVKDPYGITMQDRLRAMIERSKKEQELLNARLEKILTAEQYAQYLVEQAGSPAADMELWHQQKNRQPGSK